MRGIPACAGTTDLTFRRGLNTTMTPPIIHIMLVDDHPLVRDGLRARLEAVPQFKVVAEAGDAAEALAQAATCTVDLILMDINLRGANGIEATAQLHARFPR